MSGPDDELGAFPGVAFMDGATTLKWDRTPRLLPPTPHRRRVSLGSLCVVDAPTLAVEFDKSLLILY